MAHNTRVVGVGEKGNTRRTLADLVSSNYFAVLGVPPADGRAFLPEEEKPGRGQRVAIVSYGFWQKHSRDPVVARPSDRRQWPRLHHRGHHAGRLHRDDGRLRTRVLAAARRLRRSRPTNRERTHAFARGSRAATIAPRRPAQAGPYGRNRRTRAEGPRGQSRSRPFQSNKRTRRS